MEHSFNIKHAEKYGIEIAILIKNLQFWIAKNKANSKNFHDGKYWTYNSAKAFSELFPYMNEKKISRLLKKMETELNIIQTGNYNNSAYDRTKWYAFTDAFKNNQNTISEICEMDDKEIVNQNDKNEQPIPNVNTDNKQSDIKTNKKTINYNDFILKFNKITGKRIRIIDKKTKGQLNARIKEGFSLLEIYKAIDNCSKDKYHIENPKYLTPEFITRSDKLQKYLNCDLTNDSKNKKTTDNKKIDIDWDKIFKNRNNEK